MRRLGKWMTLFRNIKAERNFGVDITPIPWAGETSECCDGKSHLNPRYVLLLNSFIYEISQLSWKRLNASVPVEFWKRKVLISYAQTFVDNLRVTLVSWEILIAVVTFSFQQLWRSVDFTIEGGETSTLILILFHLLCLLFCFNQ